MLWRNVNRAWHNFLKDFTVKMGKNSIFKIWVITFSALVFILTIMGAIVYGYSTKNNYEEHKKSYISSLGYIRNNIDNEYDKIQRLIMMIYTDEGIVKLGRIGNDRSISTNEFVEMQKRFVTYRELLSIKEEYYIVFPDRDLCLTSASVYDKQLFNDIYVKSQELFSLEQIEFFDDKNSKNGYIVLSKGSDKKTMARVVFLKKNGGEPFITVVVPFSKNVFYGGSDAEAAFDIVIADDDGKQQFTTGKDFDLDFKDKEENTLYNCKSGDNKRYTYAYIKSPVTQLKYTVVMDYAEYIKPVQNMKLLLAMIIFIEVLLVAFLLVLFVINNYRSINQIVSIFPQSDEKKNEYDFIRERINSLFTAYRDNEKRIEHHKKQLKYLYIEKLITHDEKGAIGGKYDEYAQNIEFLSDCFAIILFYVFDDGVLKDSGMDSGENSIVEVAIRNITEELAGEKNRGFLVELSGMYCCLLNFSPERKGKTQDALELANKTVEFLSEKLEFGVKAAVGQCVYGFENISKSYSEIVLGLEEKIYCDDNSVIKIGDKDKVVAEDENIYKRIIEFVNDGDTSKALAAFDEMLNKLEGKGVSEKLKRYTVNNFLFAIVDILNDMGKNDFVFIGDIKNILKIVHNNKGLDETEYIRDTINRICHYNSCKKNGTEKQLYVKMKRYIDENWNNYELSSAVVADEFNVSLNYFLRFYKNNAGISFVEYLHTIRIKKAMELLDNSNNKVETVFKYCGYTSYDTFIRAFKRHTGMKPTEYRERIR